MYVYHEILKTFIYTTLAPKNLGHNKNKKRVKNTETLNVSRITIFFDQHRI